MYILCLVMHILFVYALNYYLAFLGGQGLAFFGEDRLATLLGTYFLKSCAVDGVICIWHESLSLVLACA